MIEKRENGWYVVSKTLKDKEGKPRSLGGPYATREEAEARLKEVEAFKHMEEAENIPHVYYTPPEGGDAPEGVKGILSGAYNSCRAAWVKDHPGDKENEANKTSCSKIAWSAVEKAGWAKGADGKWARAHADVHVAVANLRLAFPDLNLDADPEKALVQLRGVFTQAGDFDAEVFSVGKWNNDEYTLDDLHDMVKNFQTLANEIKPPIKLGHSDEGLNKVVTEGQPAYGWVTALKVVGKKLIATFSHVPDILKRAIKEKRYKRVSSEVYWNLKRGEQVFKRVLGAVALLGADAPAVNNLADLEALFTQSTASAGSFERRAVYTFPTEDGEHLTDSSDTNKKGDSHMPLTEEEIKKLQEDNVRLSAALDASNKQTLQIRKSAAAERMRVYCEAQVKAGAMQPSTRDAIMKGIKEGKYAYSDEGDGTFSIPFDMFRTVYELRRPGAPATKVHFDEQRGRTDVGGDADLTIEEEEEEHQYSEADLSNPGIVVDREVKKYCLKNKVDYGTGLKAVLLEKPKLARAYVEATPMVRSEQHAAQSADVDAEE